jgi:hypothetical protein
MKIHVKVIANSSKNSIELTSDGLKVHLKEKAIKGKANKALIEMLAEHFGKKKSEISIKRGLTSSNKFLEITDGN